MKNLIILAACDHTQNEKTNKLLVTCFRGNVYYHTALYIELLNQFFRFTKYNTINTTGLLNPHLMGAADVCYFLKSIFFTLISPPPNSFSDSIVTRASIDTALSIYFWWFANYSHLRQTMKTTIFSLNWIWLNLFQNGCDWMCKMSGYNYFPWFLVKLYRSQKICL